MIFILFVIGLTYQLLQGQVPCCPPFTTGSYEIEFKAGIAPKLWTHDRGRITVAGAPCVGKPCNGAKLSKFDCFFHLPWIVGARTGVFVCCNVETYLEFDYLQAKARPFAFDIDINNCETKTFKFHPGTLRECAGYWGWRYYFNSCFFQTTTWFFGAKVGAAHQSFKCGNFTAKCHKNKKMKKTKVKGNFFKKHTSISGGVNVGFDVCICQNLSFVFTAEVLANSGPRGNNFVELPRKFKHIQGLSIHTNGTEVTFPITFGLQFTF